jgi:hypothetical protein
VAGLYGLTPARRARPLLIAGALLLPPRTAQSQAPDARPEPEVEAIAVELESGCVTAGEFIERVKSRTPRARGAAAGEPARRVRVTIEGDERIIGRLVVADKDGAVVAREVEGASCQEVMDALALVLAVTLDPLTEPRRPSDVAPPRAPVEPAPSVAERPRRAGNRTHRVPARPVREVRFRHFVGAEATLLVGLVDPPMAGLGARYATSREPGSSTTLLLTLGAFATFAADAQADHSTGGRIRYQLQALDAGVCPVGALVHARVRLYPCAALTVGRFQARGIDLPGDRADAVPFFAAALAGRVTLELVGPLALMGATGVSFPLGSYSAVVVGAEKPAGQVHPLGIILALGVAARLP